jgi:hypothetical protein
VTLASIASVLSVDSEWPNRQGIAWIEVKIFQCSMTNSPPHPYVLERVAIMVVMCVCGFGER